MKLHNKHLYIYSAFLVLLHFVTAQFKLNWSWSVVTAQLNLNWSWSETLKWVGSHHPTHHHTGTFKALPGNLGS